MELDEVKKGKPERKLDVTIVRMDNVIDKMLYNIRNGQNKGSTTHIQDLDKAWKWRKGEFNVWTGMANEGKSLFIRFLAVIKAIEDKWKFLFSAPEDYPPEEFFDDLIHTYTGRSTDRDHPNFVGEETYLKAYEKLKEYFYFVYLKPPNNTIEDVLGQFKMLIDSVGADAAIIDPLMKFARPKEFMERDDIYASHVTTTCTDFARDNDIALGLVIHQLTPRLNDQGLYPCPSPYQIKGGGSWTDGSDNILSIWRPLYAKDKMDTEVCFTSHKIKKQKLVGIPQQVKMRFNRKTNRYINYETGEDLYPFHDFPAPRPVKLV